MKGHIVDIDNLVADYPTHLHQPEFWEALGRTIATYGFLEEILGKAIRALTGTTPYDGDSTEAAKKAAIEAWGKVLEKAVYDTLGALIGSFKKAAEQHDGTIVKNLDDLIEELREAAKIRNVLCHGSWPPPNDKQQSIPKFVNRALGVFDTPVDIAFLSQTQRAVIELVCDVMNSVTHLGYQFRDINSPALTDPAKKFGLAKNDVLRAKTRSLGRDCAVAALGSASSAEHIVL